jgi:flagellar biosynthesis GTPase FlhF
MDLHTFRARSLAQAIRLVRQTLGPDASLLHTRDVASPLSRLLIGPTIEVTASSAACAPSRLPETTNLVATSRQRTRKAHLPPADLQDYRKKFREDLALVIRAPAPSLVEALAVQSVAKSS